MSDRHRTDHDDRSDRVDDRADRVDEPSTLREEIDDEQSLARSSAPQEQLRSGSYDGAADPSLTEGYESGLENLRDAEDSVDRPGDGGH